MVNQILAALFVLVVLAAYLAVRFSNSVAADALQKQVTDNEQKERADLKEKADAVLAIPDDEARKKAALDLLASVRGVR